MALEEIDQLVGLFGESEHDLLREYSRLVDPAIFDRRSVPVVGKPLRDGVFTDEIVSSAQALDCIETMSRAGPPDATSRHATAYASMLIIHGYSARSHWDANNAWDINYLIGILVRDSLRCNSTMRVACARFLAWCMRRQFEPRKPIYGLAFVALAASIWTDATETLIASVASIDDQPVRSLQHVDRWLLRLDVGIATDDVADYSSVWEEIVDTTIGERGISNVRRAFLSLWERG